MLTHLKKKQLEPRVFCAVELLINNKNADQFQVLICRMKSGCNWPRSCNLNVLRFWRQWRETLSEHPSFSFLNNCSSDRPWGLEVQMWLKIHIFVLQEQDGPGTIWNRTRCQNQTLTQSKRDSQCFGAVSSTNHKTSTEAEIWKLPELTETEILIFWMSWTFTDVQADVADGQSLMKAAVIWALIITRNLVSGLRTLLLLQTSADVPLSVNIQV